MHRSSRCLVTQVSPKNPWNGFTCFCVLNYQRFTWKLSAGFVSRGLLVEFGIVFPPPPNNCSALLKVVSNKELLGYQAASQLCICRTKEKYFPLTPLICFKCKRKLQRFERVALSFWSHSVKALMSNVRMVHALRPYSCAACVCRVSRLMLCPD